MGVKYLYGIDVTGQSTFSTNVGIGTLSPGVPLQVNVSGAGDVFKLTRDNGANGELNIDFTGANTNFNSEQGGFNFETSIIGNALTIAPSGNVGIGTTSPLNTLHISAAAGSARVTSTAGGANLFLESIAGNLSRVRWNGLDNFAIRDDADSQDRLVIDTAGNVGIGTTNPGQKLDVSGSIAANSIFLYDSTSNDRNVLDLDASDNLQISTGTSTGSRAITFFTENAEKMRIDSAGNVGIGTTSPAYKLTAYGSSLNSEIVASFGSSNDQNEYTAIGLSGFIASNGATKAGLALKRNALYGTGELHFLNNNVADNSDMTLSDSKMMINSAGNVGIGTTSPNYKLSIDDNTITTIPKTLLQFDAASIEDNGGYNIDFRTSSNDTADRYVSRIRGTREASGALSQLSFWTESGTALEQRMTIIASGNVGIGTTSPSSRLHIFGTGNAYGLTLDRGGSSGNLNVSINDTLSTFSHTEDAGDAANGHGGFAFTSNAANINSNELFYVSNLAGTKFLINSSGNVGIGTTSPDAKLNISTSTAWGTAINEVLTFDNSGSGGNTSNPHSLGRIRWNTNGGTIGAAIDVIRDVPGSGNNIDLSFSTNLGGSNTTLAERMRINYNGAIQFNSYDSTNNTGTPTYLLGTDASGNIVKTNTVPGSAAGPYLPLAGGTLSGNLELAANTLNFADNGKARFGNSTDLQIYHDGSNSYINEVGTGVLSIQSDGTEVQINKGASEYIARFITDAGVKLYYDNSQKFETTSTGVTVTGVLSTTDDITINNSSPELYFKTGATHYSWMVAAQENVNQTFEITPSTVVGGTTFSTPALKIDGGTSNATFAGDVVVNGSIQALDSNLNLTISGDTGGNAYYSNSVGTHRFRAGGSSVNSMEVASTYITLNEPVTATSTVTAPTFLGDLNGTINTVTTAVTKANATNDTTVATTAFVQNLIGTIPAGLVYQGTWNASTNTPTLTSGTGTTGNFYIVSVDGSTNLDGTTDWKVGDWAVFVEQGASDQWEKVDNSSVLDGAGTGQTVALWSGSGTSNTLTDAPITVSGNNVKIASTGDTTLILESANPGSPGIDFYEGTSEKAHITFDTVNNVLTMGRAGGDLSIDNSGNVGIGTTSPGAKLTVKSPGEVGSYGDGFVLERNGTSAKLIRMYESSADGYLEVRTGADGIVSKISGYSGTPSYFLSNVGIGTASPTEKLTVIGPDSSTGTIKWQNGGSRRAGYLYSDTGGVGIYDTTLSEAGIYMMSNNRIDFRVNGSEKLRITSAGNVGIGTTSPGNKLHVEGRIEGDNFVLGGSDSTVFYGLYRAGVETREVRLVSYAATPSSKVQLGFNDISGSTYTFAPALTAMYNGNVGIGTTVPSSKLDVDSGTTLTYNPAANQPTAIIANRNTSNTNNEVATLGLHITGWKGLTTAVINLNAIQSNGNSSTADFSIQTRNNGTYDEKFRITAAGNVGIGTTDPATHKLIVSGGSSLASFRSEGSGQNLKKLSISTGGDRVVLDASTTADATTAFAFQTGGSERMRIDSSGNVGIGTTSPLVKLQVSDTAAGYVSTIENLGTGADKSGLWVKTDSSWTNAIILKLTGSPSDVSIMEVNNATVRIGGGTLTVNDAKLHVVGDINIINANLSNQENLDVDTGTEVVSIVPIATYTAAFFDFVVKNGTNVRSGTVYACHDGTSVEYTETSTADLGNTSAVVFTVDISAGNMRLLATTTTDNWSVKTLTKTI